MLRRQPGRARHRRAAVGTVRPGGAARYVSMETTMSEPWLLSRLDGCYFAVHASNSSRSNARGRAQTLSCLNARGRAQTCRAQTSCAQTSRAQALSLCSVQTLSLRSGPLCSTAVAWCSTLCALCARSVTCRCVQLFVLKPCRCVQPQPSNPVDVLKPQISKLKPWSLCSKLKPQTSNPVVVFKASYR